MVKRRSQLRPGIPAADQLVCPNCGERLVPADLEIYPNCPYCNWCFQREGIEDFTLLPVINHWVSRANSQFGSGN